LSRYNHFKLMILLLFAGRWLNIFDDNDQKRCWKSFDWSAMDRLYDKGYINDPKSKSRSVALTGRGAAKSRELFEKHFGIEV